ncbi:MAG: hypoxanthine phosphoribosyltransferase [Nitrospiraceae bacterium]|jgi:hypoxanthine phosphoribosyltransferase|nr:hypoxanthine phosphoribosyltransferase [Nitrospiraceae bacterium]
MIFGKPLLAAEQIQEKVADLAAAISRDYAGKEILAVGILKGSFMFFADLIRLINVPTSVDFILATSYIKTGSSGKVTVHYDVREQIAGKHVLLIDDIIDTGVSLDAIREGILAQHPASLKLCVLLDKQERRVVNVPVDYVGFTIPNQFVVGYGLDYENHYRNMPYIAIFTKKK